MYCRIFEVDDIEMILCNDFERCTGICINIQRSIYFPSNDRNFFSRAL